MTYSNMPIIKLPIKYLETTAKFLYSCATTSHRLYQSFLHNLINPTQNLMVVPNCCHGPPVPANSNLQRSPGIMARQPKLQLQQPHNKVAAKTPGKRTSAGGT